MLHFFVVIPRVWLSLTSVQEYAILPSLVVVSMAQLEGIITRVPCEIISFVFLFCFKSHFKLSLSAMKKLFHCIELILVETDLGSRMQNRRVKVSHQNDLVSCGWRVCLNAVLLVKSILKIEVCFFLFINPKYYFFFLFLKMSNMFSAFKCVLTGRIPWILEITQT